MNLPKRKPDGIPKGCLINPLKELVQPPFHRWKISHEALTILPKVEDIWYLHVIPVQCKNEANNKKKRKIPAERLSYYHRLPSGQQYFDRSP